MSLLIAEIGSVHDGSFGNALKLVDLAKKCNANAVKFQTHISDAETTQNAPSPSYFKDESRYDYFNRTAFSKDQWVTLSSHCRNIGIGFVSSPFSIEAAELLLSVEVEYMKVPSGEVTNLPLISFLSQASKPVILSSGMSNWQELDAAVSSLIGKVPLTVMQCTSMYPCPNNFVGLNILSDLKTRYGSDICIGFSDHTYGISAGPAAAALGATVIEKHLTFSRDMYGSDAANALDPVLFSQYSQCVFDVWEMNNSPVDKNNIIHLSDMKDVFQKSIVAATPLKSGTTITIDKIAFKKPGTGICASKFESLLGKKLQKDIPCDHFFTEDDFQ